MKLRRLTTYDRKTGYQDKERLQYWDNDCEHWEDVPFVKIPREDEELSKYDKNAIY